MKFTLSWLKDHLDTTASVAEIAEALTDLGLEVEGIENPAEALKHFVLGKVVAAERHPDADKLQICRVDLPGGEDQIICGAPNARAGITVVVARPGTYVPGPDFTIGVGKIRGVESHGMMCSERELGLGDAHEGIIELPSGEVGQSYADWLAEHDPSKVDPVIEIAITPNRGDALGIRGIARDLSARGIGRLKPLNVNTVPAGFPSPIGVEIAPDTRDGCPIFAGRVIRGVKNGPSPQWMQDRLRAIGLRPISFLVDVTNYMTFDLNRPLHVFDADKVSGNLRIHRAAGGESFAALDERSYTLAKGMIAISADGKVESLAGVMGGAETGVTEETTNVFVESALWNPVQIALTGRALRIHSDARYRFERGIDTDFSVTGLQIAVRMIVDHAGGEASETVIAGTTPDTSRAYRFDPSRVKRIVGMEIPEKTQRATLDALGFRLDDELAHVPAWRSDIQGEADLVEEVARVASLSRLEGKPLPRPEGVAKPVLTPMQARLATARRTTAALGYDECVTYSFVDRAAAALFGGGDDATRLENPISADLSHMRPDLLPGLLRAAARNQARGFADLALFEAGHIFTGGEPGEQRLAIAGLLTGRSGPKDVHGAARPVDLFDAKADAEAVLAAIGAPAKVQILRGAEAWWHPGRHGKICLGPKKVIGVFGELHPKVLRELEVKGPVVGFVIYPEEVPLPRANGSARPAFSTNDLQPVERDFAFVVDAEVEALTLVNAAQGADKALIADVRVFDQFQGGNLGDGRKSLAITVRLQPKDTTLTEADIEAVSAKIVDKVAKATGGVLRG